MARARNIKPSFFTNDRLAECDPTCRLLFIGLWTVADRNGRLEDRPKKIKAELLPYDPADCDSLLDDLQRHGFIHRYSVGESRYIQVVNFAKHQNPHVKEQASTIPAPGMPGANTILAGPLTDSLLLIPDSLSLRSRGAASQAEAAAPAPKSNRSQRGTRLSSEWDLPDVWGMWAEQQGMGRDAVIRECDKFKDYWISKSGTAATKTDWQATWRNWIRKHLEEYAK